MPTQVTNYQCPACTGPLHYSAKSGKLACDYCGSSFDVAEIEALYARKEAEAAAAKQAADAKAEAAQAAKAEAAEAAAASGGWDTSDLSRDWGAEADGLRVYSCPSCGAELICDQSTAATACPYCGNPAIVPGQFSGALRPDYILPFRLSKDDAVQALRAHYKGKPFLPRSFTSANHIEQIQGVYVPFWLFDGGAEGAASYRASNTNVFETGDYEITETRHYHVVRAGSLAFEKIPVDASSKMPDDHMDSIEPFDYAQLRPFSTAYLPGYLADKYDVTIDDSRDRADTRCRETLAQALRDTVTGYGACVTEREDIALRRGKVHYALLPVWMLSTKWRGQDFLFAMNGQTGKLVGDLPTDRGRFWGMFAAIAAPLTVALTAILQFLL
ncbi:MAG: hypothetical protein ACLR5E_05025 [Oscillospiraceae bacterium]|jgi:uncharacterized Zn finger protein (UPF0148 family)|nr:hypothetical protein [Oscillospiraceae bacterium]MBS6834701.1 hypothetical protein [Bacillota bacterium]HCG32214.1 hypothetical protein [Clostridiales bacterium]